MQRNSESLQREINATKEANRILQEYIDILKDNKDYEIEKLKAQIERLEKDLRNSTKETTNQVPPCFHKINSSIYVSKKSKGLSHN